MLLRTESDFTRIYGSNLGGSRSMMNSKCFFGVCISEFYYQMSDRIVVYVCLILNNQ